MVTGGRHIRTLKTQSDEDEEELRSLQTDRSTFLCTAMDNYLRCLETGVSCIIGVSMFFFYILYIFRMTMIYTCFGWCHCGLLIILITLLI